MADTLWGDLAGISARMETVERRVDELASVTPAHLMKLYVGMQCALAVVERQMKEIQEDVAVLQAEVAGTARLQAMQIEGAREREVPQAVVMPAAILDAVRSGECMKDCDE